MPKLSANQKIDLVNFALLKEAFEAGPTGQSRTELVKRTKCYRETIGVSGRTLHRNVQRLIKENLLEKSGERQAKRGWKRQVTLYHITRRGKRYLRNQLELCMKFLVQPEAKTELLQQFIESLK
jgi:DNA-binding MarR family transcriptional regulator